MEQKSVSDMIIDKFAEQIEKDKVFKDISVDLIDLARQEKPSKMDFEKLLRKIEDEDSKPGN